MYISQEIISKDVVAKFIQAITIAGVMYKMMYKVLCQYL